jgi:hypothetical protein
LVIFACSPALPVDSSLVAAHLCVIGPDLPIWAGDLPAVQLAKAKAERLSGGTDSLTLRWRRR